MSVLSRRRFLVSALAVGLGALGADLTERGHGAPALEGPFDAAAAARRILGSKAAASDDHDVLAYRARALARLSPEGLSGTLDRLWSLRYVTGGHPGFGLGYAWDAFSDGTTNPVDTIYTYTTATAALAFLDGGQLERAAQLVETILSRAAGSGAVWYSDQPQDRGKVVPNVNALTLTVLVRLGSEPAWQGSIRNLLRTTMIGGGAWPYLVGVAGQNDLEHHSFMVEGVTAAGMSEAAAASAHLASFFNPDGSFDQRSSVVMGSTRWGPADGLAALTLDGRRRGVARNVARVLADSVGVDGVSSFADPSNPRSVIHYAYGLARYAAGV